MSMTKLPFPPILMDEETSAAYLMMGRRTFRQIVATGAITRRRVGPKMIRYVRTELDDFALQIAPGRGEPPIKKQ